MRGKESDKVQDFSFYMHQCVNVMLATAMTFATGTALHDYADMFRMPYEYALQIALIILSYVIIVTSWLHYSMSIENYPYRLNWGILRFIVDIMIVFLYMWLLLVTLEFQDYVLSVIVIFSLYTVWDALRLVEYWSASEARHYCLRRLGINFLFTLPLGVFHFLFVTSLYKIKGFEWAYVAILYTIVVLYRVIKLPAYIRAQRQ